MDERTAKNVSIEVIIKNLYVFDFIKPDKAGLLSTDHESPYLILTSLLLMKNNRNRKQEQNFYGVRTRRDV